MIIAEEIFNNINLKQLLFPYKGLNKQTLIIIS